MRDLLNRLSGRQSKSQNNLSLNDFFDNHYYPHILHTKKTHNHDSYTYGKHFRKQLGKLPINRIDNKVADDWVRQQIAAGYKNSTINKHINMLVRLLNVAQQWRMIDDKVFYSSMLRHLPMGNFRQRFLSDVEIPNLLLECNKSPHPYLYHFVRLPSHIRTDLRHNIFWRANLMFSLFVVL